MSDHYDHLDERSILGMYKKQQSNPPLFLVPLKLGQWFTKRGISHWVELDWWQSMDFNGWTFTAVPVQHFSGRGIRQNTTLWAGWVMESSSSESTPPKRIFFAGDTGYSRDFTEIGNHFGGMDLSLIPIGAYEPRWFMKEMHVNPDEAVQIHRDVKSRFSVGMHWGSFILTDEPMDQPPKHLALAKEKYGVSKDAFVVLDHGEVFMLDDRFKSVSPWEKEYESKSV